MAFAPFNIHTDGCFTEASVGNLFEFNLGINHHLDPFCPMGYPDRVWVTTPRDGLDSGWRYAKVLKTVAYIVVDEADDGSAIVEKWAIKGRRDYQ